MPFSLQAFYLQPPKSVPPGCRSPEAWQPSPPSSEPDKQTLASWGLRAVAVGLGLRSFEGLLGVGRFNTSKPCHDTEGAGPDKNQQSKQAHGLQTTFLCPALQSPDDSLHTTPQPAPVAARRRGLPKSAPVHTASHQGPQGPLPLRFKHLSYRCTTLASRSSTVVSHAARHRDCKLRSANATSPEVYPKKGTLGGQDMCYEVHAREARCAEALELGQLHVCAKMDTTH